MNSIVKGRLTTDDRALTTAHRSSVVPYRSSIIHRHSLTDNPKGGTIYASFYAQLDAG